MKDIAEAIAEELSGSILTTVQIGTGPHARVFHHVARQNVCLPLVVLDESGGVVSEHLGGGARGWTGLSRADFNIWSFGATVKEATDLFEATRQVLHKRGPEDIQGLWVNEITMGSDWRSRSYFIPGDNSQRYLYSVIAGYGVWYQYWEN